MTKGYIFDYGGTLDTGGHHWANCIWHAYKQAGAPVSEAQFREAYVYAERALGQGGMISPGHTFRQTLLAKVRLQTERMAWPAGMDVVDGLYDSARRHTAQSREVLSRLKERSTLALVSNFYGNLATVLREMGLDTLFDTVVESAAVGVRKPDPAIFTIAVQRMGLAPDEVTVVGDSLKNDILPAKAAGCHTVWLKGGQWDDGNGGEAAADRVIADLRELINS